MLSTLSWKSSPRLAFDVGTANLRVISSEGGVLFDEPSICCFQADAPRSVLVAAGTKALPMTDRTHPRLRVDRPLRRGVLQDLNAARALFRYASECVLGRRRCSSKSTLIGVPADATQAEQRALMTAARDANLGTIQLVSEPILAAIGARLPIMEATGCMLVECGAGTTEAVVISLGSACVRRTVRVGGDSLDQAIGDFLHFRYKFLIGEQTAEKLKLELANIHSTGSDENGQIEIRGRSIETGMPGILLLPGHAFGEVLTKHFALIVGAVVNTLNETPPELSLDILDRGIILTGGSALFPLLAQMIGEATGLNVIVAEDPRYCVARGLQEMLAH
ncbi:MAG TPA: rod shape-determining protein [Sphingobium sp.]|uniref:rod shape-determining protein n=1 Tax=Sphingobium sp. TaxID=1912891 RepID=UPI002ED33876